MAKELPYFQFEPAEYLTKDVSFCSLSAQGLFINICSYYWQRECNLTKEQLLKRLNYPIELKELIEEKVIFLEENNIKVKFLDAQYKKATNTSKTNSVNGSKGGRPKKINPIKSEIKPNINPIKSETKGIIEDNIIEYKIKEDKKHIFNKWINYRKQIKKPLNVSATLNALIERINKEPLDKVNWVINNSIENNYQGLFWENYKGNTKKTSDIPEGYYRNSFTGQLVKR